LRKSYAEKSEEMIKGQNRRIPVSRIVQRGKGIPMKEKIYKKRIF
jgi:hypothetical protein